MRLVFVVTWRFYDGSASGAVSVHPTEEAAGAMVELLQRHADGMKAFAVEAVPGEI